MEDADFTIQFETPETYNLRGTFWLAGMGERDPTLRLDKDDSSLALNTPGGPVTIQASRRSNGVQVGTIGPGGEWIQPRLNDILGLDDHPETFQPTGPMARLVKQNPGLHLPRLPVVFSRLVQIVLQQLITWRDALHGWRTIVARFGSDAPCGQLRLPPTAADLSELGYYDLVECRVLPKQARLILHLAHEAKRIERLAADSPERLAKFLLSIKGIGDWTVQHLLGTSFGDADAVLTGDYGLPNTVSWFLIRKPRSNDEEMLRLLEPFRGHRFRVVNYLWQNHVIAPRHAPRMKSNRWRFTNRG